MNNFKTIEVKAYTKQEAIEKAPFQILKDATQAWKNAGKPMTGTNLKEFMAEYLEKNTKFTIGNGCMITVEPGSADTRERPYTVNPIKNEQGKRNYKTAIQGVDVETGKVMFTCFGTKDDAEKLAKKLYKDGYRGNIHAIYTKQVTEGEAGAFDVEYTPSKNAKEGTYLFFGVEA